MARPTKMTADMVQKLERAFIGGLSDREACVYADIALSTLYNYCGRHPAFTERKETLKEGVKMRAKLNLAEKIGEGDIELSKWYIERKCKDEFSAKQEIGQELFGTLKVEIAGGDDFAG